LPPELLFLAQIYAPNRLSAGASPQTQLGSLRRSPDHLAVFRGLLLRGAREREGGKETGGREGEGREFVLSHEKTKRKVGASAQGVP